MNYILMPLKRGQEGEAVTDEPRMQEPAFIPIAAIPTDEVTADLVGSLAARSALSPTGDWGTDRTRNSPHEALVIAPPGGGAISGHGLRKLAVEEATGVAIASSRLPVEADLVDPVGRTLRRSCSLERPFVSVPIGRFDVHWSIREAVVGLSAKT